MNYLRSLSLLFLSAIFVLGTSSCEKDEMSAQEKTDQKLILEYLAANNLDATRHSSGLYYKIHHPGNGEYAPTTKSVVRVKYKGTFLDGTVFDETKEGESALLGLSSVIKGWRIGIPMIKPGGKISLYVPSDLGYGKKGSGTKIPGNKVLIFDVELLSFY